MSNFMPTSTKESTILHFRMPQIVYIRPEELFKGREYQNMTEGACRQFARQQGWDWDNRRKVFFREKR